MEYNKTIISQIRMANISDDEQVKLQTSYIQSGEKVITLGDTQYIIQKCPELFYKLLELTELKHELKMILHNTPDALRVVTTTRMLEIELIQTAKLDGLKLDKTAIRNIIINDSSKKQRVRDLIDFHNQILSSPFTVESPLHMRKLYYDYVKQYLTANDLAGLGPVYRNNRLRRSVSKQYKSVRGASNEFDIYNNMITTLDYLNNSDENIFIKIAIFHYLMEVNQPFSKYNGMINRLITNSYLYPQIGIASFALSNTLVQNKTDYYTLVEETADQLNVNDLTAFVYNFISYIIDSINYIKRFLAQNNKRIEKFVTKLTNLDISNNEKTCLVILHQAHLVGEPLSTKQLVEQSSLTNPTVLKCMTKLEQNNYATITKPGKQKIISLNPEWLKSL